MANISIDGHTLEANPSKMEMVKPEKRNSHVKTIGGVQFWDWGSFIAGKEIPISFTYMSASEFDDLHANHYTKPGLVVFDPQMGDGKTYNAKWKDFTGDLVRKISGTGAYRENIKALLVIDSEVP